MNILLPVIKCGVFTFNLICLILGMGFICISAFGLQNVKPSTDEHTYFIVGIILGSLVCMITLFGFYGVICELLGINIIYAFFILILFVVQYLQMQTFQAHTFYRHTLQDLQKAWLLVETQPSLMKTFETGYHCCALYNSRDYNYKYLAAPISCYKNADTSNPTNLYTAGCLAVVHNSYEFAINREKVFNWALITSECLVFIYSVILSILFYKRNTRSLEIQPVRGFVEPRTNHIDSRSNLLSNMV